MQAMADSRDDPFLPARQALERGEYTRVLQFLEPLVVTHPPATASGGQLQLLMATAWMGKGNTVRAMACCRQVKRCADATLRDQARELLSVLEAPALARPREWSLTLPELNDAEPIAGRLGQMARRRRTTTPPAPPPPPVGPTRAPLGFAALALALLLVTLLLSGCVQVRSELHFGTPGRLQLIQQISTPPGRPPLPWQKQYVSALKGIGLHGAPGSAGRSSMRLESAMQPAETTLTLLGTSIDRAVGLAGLQLPPATLQWKERNWLIGVQQHLSIELDLRDVESVPGLEASLDLQPLQPRAITLAQPQPVESVSPTGRGRSSLQRWPLRLGADNQLVLRCWRWSPLGLGAVVIGLLLLLVLILATLRERLGFGWPKLPA